VKSITVIALFTLATFRINAIAAETNLSLICHASQAAGFELSNYNRWQPFGGRDGTIFKITDSERTGYSSYVKAGNDWSYWSSMDDTSSTAYIVSDGPSSFYQITIRKDNLKFQAIYSGGYLNGTKKGTATMIGTCRNL